MDVPAGIRHPPSVLRGLARNPAAPAAILIAAISAIVYLQTRTTERLHSPVAYAELGQS